MKSLEEKKKDIQELGLEAIRDYFQVDVGSLEPELVKQLHNKARIGMQFEKEMNLSNRAVEMNYLRVFRLIAEDKKELKRYIKKSLPKYLPD